MYMYIHMYVLLFGYIHRENEANSRKYFRFIGAVVVVAHAKVQRQQRRIFKGQPKISNKNNKNWAAKASAATRRDEVNDRLAAAAAAVAVIIKRDKYKYNLKKRKKSRRSRRRRQASASHKHNNNERHNNKFFN